MLKRIVSALAMIPILIGAIIYPEPWTFNLLVLLGLTVALFEYYSMVWQDPVANSKNISHKMDKWLPRVYRGFGSLLGLLCAMLWLFGLDHALSPVAVSSALVIIGLIVFAFGSPVEGAQHRVGHLLFGVFYVAGLGIHLAYLRNLDAGVFWVFAVLFATWGNDTFAYFAGHMWGRHRLAPSLSPGKTWEGWAGGIVGAAVGLLLVSLIFPNPLEAWQLACLVLLASIFGPLGDLCESMLKRSVGVKDSGHLIPGHGGLLDRIDALLFNGPLFYYFALLIS